MLRNVPQVLQTAYYERLRGSSFRVGDWPLCLRWLQFYLNFCDKYRHPPRDRESLLPFLQKLAAKDQSPADQQQAAACVQLYYDLVRDWNTGAAAALAPPASSPLWTACHARLKEEIRIRQYARKTFLTYSVWIRQFQAFVADKDPAQLTKDDARAFLTHLAVDKRVVASTQNQAFNALLFLYRHILKADYELGDTVVRARRTRYIPVVLSREEVDAVLARLQPPFQLVVSLLYGCGLRLAEGLGLRVQCFDFDQGLLTIHDGKGRKDRTVPLPRRLFPALRAQSPLDLDAGPAGFAGTPPEAVPSPA